MKKEIKKLSNEQLATLIKINTRRMKVSFRMLLIEEEIYRSIFNK